jgi:dipeptidyl aminopeptidase/acylaminoacyl peptidase
MGERKIAPYGSWKSPVTADLIAGETIGLGAIRLDGEDVYWIEMRPREAGRYVVIRRRPGGQTEEVTPPPFNARTRVHEYGGSAYLPAGGIVYFSNFSDQRLYRLEPGADLAPVTAAGEFRYADYQIDPRRNRLVCVREDHSQAGREAANTLVSIDLEPGAPLSTGQIIASGYDFYSNPRLSPDGKRLAWLCWNHPNLPWDGTELWVGELDESGRVREASRAAGGEDESIFQPEWSPDGTLHFVSDRTGWWNLYRWQNGESEPLVEMEAEFGLPQWSFGTATYGFDSPERIVCAYIQQGESHLASLDTRSKQLATIDTPYTDIWGVQARPGKAYFSAGSPLEPASLIALDLASGEREVLRRSSEVDIDPGYIAVPEAVEFPTEHGQTAYGFFYPPRNKDFQAPAGERPPLLVMSHGGPTGATTAVFSLEVQYWTSRGIAVLDVNYGGSTGYGRAYRERLNGQWGVVDVDDCVNGARYLVARGDVDGERLAITGGSAGGYTTLCALTFRDVFKAGASHFGIGDLTTFVHDTHKFESRYLDRLVGPYPERAELYRERSPILHTQRLSCAMILFQGLEDKIVPPNQAETMFSAVRAKELPVAYLPFEGEQHGFRRAENIKRALEGELYFYARIFGFELADPVEPVEIENL